MFNILAKPPTVKASDVKTGNSLYYVGDYKEGVADGRGKVVAQGMRYEGSIRMGQMHCQNARIEYDNGDVYVGTVEQGVKNGVGGTYTYNNGDVYDGPFRNDFKHGENGKLVFKRHQVVYKGEF